MWYNHNCDISRECKSNLASVLAAPGTYSPEKVNLSKSPQYSFGVKTEIREKNAIPGAVSPFTLKRNLHFTLFYFNFIELLCVLYLAIF